MERIGRVYFWISKLLVAVLVFAGCMHFLGGVNDLDRVLVYIASAFITAYSIKESW